jgi:7-cyano-7-deazaguanine synthase in queuosine biosynthesis
MSFKLHERNSKEIEAAKKISEETNIKKHIIIDVGFLKEKVRYECRCG